MPFKVSGTGMFIHHQETESRDRTKEQWMHHRTAPHDHDAKVYTKLLNKKNW